MNKKWDYLLGSFVAFATVKIIFEIVIRTSSHEESSLRYGAPVSEGLLKKGRRGMTKLTVSIDSPDTSLVPIVCAQSLAVAGVPHADRLVLARCEEQVAWGVHSQLMH